MDFSMFLSRKLLATVGAVALVAVSDLLGLPLTPETLDAIQTMLFSFVGAQGAVDTAKAWKAGKAIASSVEAVQDLTQPEQDPQTDPVA